MKTSLASLLLLLSLALTAHAGGRRQCDGKDFCARKAVNFPHSRDPIWVARRGIPTGDAPLGGRPIWFPATACCAAPTLTYDK